MIEVFTDGGARGNPGPAAAAVVVKKSGKVIFKTSKYLGTTTNNAAEYSALILALTYLLENPPDEEVNFFLDSELVVRQVTGVYKVKNENIRNYCSVVFAMLEKIKVAKKFNAIPRARNKVADALVNEELDKQLH